MLQLQKYLKIINDEDKTVPLAVEKELPYIEKAVDKIVEAIKKGGRLLYFGAGTSGRLGVVDASECPPTFGTPAGNGTRLYCWRRSSNVCCSRGSRGSMRKMEPKDVLEAKVNTNDVVCGIAASRRTPYVIGAVKKAKEIRRNNSLYYVHTKRYF